MADSQFFVQMFQFSPTRPSEKKLPKSPYSAATAAGRGGGGRKKGGGKKKINYHEPKKKKI